MLAIVAGTAFAWLALVLSVVTLRLRGLYTQLATLAVTAPVIPARRIIDIRGPSGIGAFRPFHRGVEFATQRAMYYVVFAIEVTFLGTGAMRSDWTGDQGDSSEPDAAAAPWHQQHSPTKLAAF